VVWGLLVFAAVLLPIVLDVLGHRVGVVGFEPIVEHFENAASEFAQPVLEGVLKLPRRFWRDGLKQERLHQLANSLELRLSGDSRFFSDALHVLGNQAYQKRENRLRSCIEASFPGYVFVLLLKPEYSCRRRLYFVRPISTDPPLNQTTPKNVRFSRFLIEWKDCTHLRRASRRWVSRRTTGPACSRSCLRPSTS